MPSTTRVGYGLLIQHSLGLVVNPDTIIGNNVTIYSGAIVIGGIHIGDHAKIGAGAVVVNDVPPNATIVGQPMRVIEH